MASDSTRFQANRSCSSITTFRARAHGALELKYEYKAVNVLKGQHFSPEFTKLNALNYVPVLVDGDIVIADSLAIILYLEEKHPHHPFLPQDLHKKAINFQGLEFLLISFSDCKVGLDKNAEDHAALLIQWNAAIGSLTKAANIVCSNIQPFQNHAVINYIEEKVSSDEKLVWARYHIGKGFAALEKLLKPFAGRYATGDEVFLADLFLAPQIHCGINWFKVDMTDFPLLCRLDDAYRSLPAFVAAMPDMQPDAVKP